MEALLAQLTDKKSYRRCFLLPERDKLVPLPTSDIAYVYIDAKTVKMVSLEHKTYYLTQTLDDLMAQLDPQIFFRANRQFIVSRDAIKELIVSHGGKCASSVSGSTSFLLAGTKPGPEKIRKCAQLGIPVKSEEEFRKMLPGAEAAVPEAEELTLF